MSTPHKIRAGLAGALALTLASFPPASGQVTAEPAGASPILQPAPGNFDKNGAYLDKDEALIKSKSALFILYDERLGLFDRGFYISIATIMKRKNSSMHVYAYKSNVAPGMVSIVANGRMIETFQAGDYTRPKSKTVEFYNKVILLYNSVYDK